MKFSLINVDVDTVNCNRRINGTWIQNLGGVTLQEAIERAREIEKVNSFSFKVVVVEEISYVPNYSLLKNLIPLNL